METVSCWAMGDSLDDLLGAPEADVNLVVSSLGMKAAEYLKKTFGIPAVCGLPAEGIREEVLCDLKKAAGDRMDRFPCRDLRGKKQEGEAVLLIGEPVTMGSLAGVLEKKRGCRVRLVCPTEDCEAFMAEGDILTRGEEEVEKAFREGEQVIADPLYQPIVPPSCPFVPLPHLAFSGRIFLKDMPDLFGDLSGILPVTGEKHPGERKSYGNE